MDPKAWLLTLAMFGSSVPNGGGSTICWLYTCS